MEVQLLLGDELLVAVLAKKVQLAPVTLLTGDQLLLVSNKKIFFFFKLVKTMMQTRNE